MPAAGLPGRVPDDVDGQPPVRCEACQYLFAPDHRRDVSFLLLDHLVIPLLSCEVHRERFASICGLTTDDTAEVIDHHPAGGVRCPGCRTVPYDDTHVVIPVRDGALAVLACPEHLTEILQRFHAGLALNERLTAPLGTTRDERSPFPVDF